MDKSWMLLGREDPLYIMGIYNFVNYARNQGNGAEWYKCPCRMCCCNEYVTDSVMYQHLSHYGMWQSYTTWTDHGEVATYPTTVEFQASYSHQAGTSSGIGGLSMDPTMNMLVDNFPYVSRYDQAEEFDVPIDTSDFDKYKRLLTQAQTPLYPGCSETVLSALMSQMQLKVRHKWSNVSYDENCQYIKRLLHPENLLPDSYYKTKKILDGLGLEYVKIDACKYNCELFYGDYKDYDECPVCNESRWKASSLYQRKKVPVKVLRYFPLTPRLQRLYMASHTAEAMRWHGRARDDDDDDDVLKHPSDGEAWKHFDRQFPDFPADVRNVRLGLSTDGFNPWGNMSSTHSTWPVIVVPYNLPPWMCMKKEFNILTLLIPGPKSPGKCLDVYLRPLIDELKDLWNNGKATFDRHSQSSFRMRAAIMWTISDFPAYGMLSSQTTHGYKACPVCLDNVNSSWHAGKVCYMGHRRWLPVDHEWRFDASAFDGTEEWDTEPQKWSGDEVLDKMNSFDFGPLSGNPKIKKIKRPKHLACWQHKSIFFELPYWSKSIHRNSLDVMHIEKNVSDSVVGTTLDLKDKTKDNIKARVDLENMGLREHLWLKKTGTKVEMPIAPYEVKPSLKPWVFKWFHDVKYPQGYAANIARCVKVEEQKIIGLKTHDSHVLMQRLLPVVIRPYLHFDVVEPLVALSSWWQKLCTREVKKSDLLKLKEEIVYILCKLERIFPPAFFDIMVHLMVHLPDQVLLTGPVHYTWMFPIERQLGDYKGYVRNRANPEGSITTAYISHECMRKLQRENSQLYSPQMQHLASMPQSHNVYAACVVNGVRFLTEFLDQGKKTQNCGVMVEDKNGGPPYYGVLVSVIELLYGSRMPVVLFKCRWFNTDPSVRRSTRLDHGLLSVNTHTSWYENEPFILATMAKQVFYLDDPKLGRGWKVVNMMSHRNIFDARTLAQGVEQDIDNMAIEPYQEPSTSAIHVTNNICINNEIHFQASEYVPIEFDFDPLPYIPRTEEDFINDEDENDDEDEDEDEDADEDYEEND
ncbi:uncharacterized protein LOC126802710 [Argentina anserina]|uniref:uncharacterized protein LOC126802710 n=1 Tax=Argentina anserina TaxID=57926 RepID=UPI00217636E8|nr:uncharacterized protein LOC126802710 [Potentilla anserina]